MVLAAGLVLAALAAQPAGVPPPPAAVPPPPPDSIPPPPGAEAPAPPAQPVHVQLVFAAGPHQHWIAGDRQPRGAIAQVAIEEADPAVTTVRVSGDLSDTTLVGEIGLKVLTPRFPIRAFGTLGVGGGYATGAEEGVLAMSAGGGLQAAFGPVALEAHLVGRMLLGGDENDPSAPRAHFEVFGTVGMGLRFWTSL